MGCIASGLAYVLMTTAVLSFVTDSPTVLAVALVAPLLGVGVAMATGDVLERMGIS